MVLASFGRRACLIAVLSLIPASVLAQGASTATIAGVVRDSSGAVLPGVTVEAASPALIEKVRSTITDERGQYRLPELRPGMYAVTFALSGFSTLKRDGLELRTNFTAQVDVELKVSNLQETITVSGSTPLVDVQTATQQRTVSREVLDTVPTAKSVLGIAALIPAVVEPPNAQDVGGSKGERSVRISVHGGKTFDSRLLQDGMRYNALTPGVGQPSATTPSTPTSPAPVFTASLEGTGRGYYINPLAVDEVVVDLGTMGSAEYSLGGAQVNSIPKSGSNAFSGSVFLAGTGSSLQSDNLDDNLQAQGLTSVNSVKKVYDINGAIGGPLVKNRLWFFASGRHWGTTTHVANLYADADTKDFLYTPDLSRPIEPVENDKGAGARVTFQASTKDKFTFSYDKQRNFQDQLTGQLETGTIKNEANQGYCQTHQVTQGTWSRPQSTNLLFDAGITVSKFNFQGFGEDLFLSDYEGCGGQLVDNVSINDSGLGFTYNGVGVGRGLSLSHQSNGRFNVSFVTSQHTIKTGVFWMYGLGGGQRAYNVRAPAQVNGLPVTYTFLNQRPTSLTEFVSPNLQVDQLSPDLALFVQDQWRLNRITVSAGLRYDWLRESVAASSVPAGALVPPQSFPAIENVPNWKDLSPRVGVVWDPRGDAKTAIKFGINRYVASATTGIANLFDPFGPGNSLASTARTWGDTNGNFLPDCDLTLKTANGECGAMLNQNFGTNVPSYRPDPNWVTGWGKRPYNWQTSVSVDRELLPYLVVNAGYYRTWYGNFMVIDNQRVTSADFSPYCVTVPTDSRLTISGQQLCGLYDLNTDKVGQIDNLVTRAKNYGTHKEIYNGVDVNVQLRLKARATVGGGWNLGNAVQLGTTAGGTASASTNSCYVVDSPQQLFNCDVKVPYQSRIKLNGSYTLPFDVQVAAVVQSNPGANYSANLAYTSAQIQSSLGRALSGGTTVTIPLAKPYSLYGPRINQLDLRATKIFRFGSRRLQGNVDAYNVFNTNTPVTIFGTYNARWGQPTQVLDGRLVKFSAQIEF
ncbi:MAG TPA: carboxypeptidase regulatory-like domain-containing protein [Vicinamibacterales bacterium]